jgi:hypothetical protein
MMAKAKKTQKSTKSAKTDPAPAKSNKKDASPTKSNKKEAAPAKLVRCTCPSGTHGHRPGKCVSLGTESNGLCKFCHSKAVADAAKDPAKMIDPLNQPRSAR